MDQLPRSTSRPGAVAAFAALALATTLTLGLSSPAAALPMCAGTTCTALFTGVDGFGISTADAAFLGTQGFDIVPFTQLDRVEQLGVDLGVFDIDFNDRSDVVPFPADDGPNMATQHYQVENVSGGDLIGDNYFLVTQIIDNFMFMGEQVDYRGTNLGLTIAADPWVIVQIDAGAMGDFFYPAINLGSLAAGANPLSAGSRNAFSAGSVADPFNVALMVDGPLVEITTQGGVFRGDVLPLMQHGSAFTLIPEPSAAALLAAGMLGLAAFGRRTHRGGS